MKLSDQFQGMVDEKCQKLKRYFDKVDRIDVVFTAEKHRRQCEIRVHAGHFDQTAIFENGDEGAAFDRALKAMQRQIKEGKVKMIERKHRTVSLTRHNNRSGRALPANLPEATL
jgi:ribosomal subunit interface protein